VPFVNNGNTSDKPLGVAEFPFNGIPQESITMKTIRERTIAKMNSETTMTALDSGEGDVVVLGHDYLWDAEMWRPQIKALSRHYRVIVPNLWGHGSSARLPRHSMDLRDIAREHLRLLDWLGIDRFTFIGHSAGGMWGAELACLAPERVTAIALLDTFVAPEPDDSRAHYFAMLDAIEAAGTIPDQVVDAILPHFFPPRLSTMSSDRPAKFRARLVGLNQDRLLDTIVPLGRMIFGRRDALTDLVHLNVPALVMTGTDDIPRPVHEGRRMAHALGCPFVELAGAGHMATLEAPDAVNEHLLAFLAETPTQRTPIEPPLKRRAVV
jgi:pimeloyl-ACP methyl ester carboxylesterase